MGLEEIYSQIRKSIVLLQFDQGPITCGIVVACKTRSAYVIAEDRGYTQGCQVMVEFEDGKFVYPTDTQCYTHDGLLGIHCELSGSAFDQNVVKKFDILDKDADMCEEVYVYDNYEETVTEGYAMKVDAYRYNLTNIATYNSKYGSPVVKKDGRLIGMCSSFEHHLTVRNMVSIASSIERSHSRIFTTVTNTLEYLDTII